MLTSWEIEIYAKIRLEKATDEKERQFLLSVISENRLLLSLRHCIYYRINLFGEKTLIMRELVRMSEDTGKQFEEMLKYLGRNK